MTVFSRIDTILTDLGSAATVEEIEFALRDFSDREVRAVLAERAAAGGGAGEPFNGGTITEPLVINNQETDAPPLLVKGAASEDFVDLWSFVTDNDFPVMTGRTDGGGEWNFQQDGAGLVFSSIVPASPLAASNSLTIADYGVLLPGITGPPIIQTDRANNALGFWTNSPVAKPTGVAVTAEGIHAALVSLGLIAGP